MLGLGSLEAAEPSAGWKAGVARVDTTPTEPVRMAGYASRTSPSQGVAHPLVAKALALADARDHKVVFVTCDIIGFRRAFTNRVTDRVKAKYGLPREDVVLFASHNHAGPTPDRASPTRTGANSPLARGIREQRRLHQRPGEQDRRPGRRGARQDGAGQPVLRHRPRPLRLEPARADRQGDQARQEPRRPDRRERADPPRPERGRQAAGHRLRLRLPQHHAPPRHDEDRRRLRRLRPGPDRGRQPRRPRAVRHRLRGRRRPPSVRHSRDGQGTRRRSWARPSSSSWITPRG